MTRTTDDINPEGTWKGLGEKVERKPASPEQPEWRQKSGAAPGIEEHRDTGRLRTNLPLPKD